MKKIVNYFLILLCLLTVVGCKKETVELVDISDLTYDEIVEYYGTDLTINPKYTPTNQYLPNTVIGYENHEVNDLVDKESEVTVLISAKPENAVSFDERVAYVSKIGLLTGNDSEKNGQLLFDAGISGTDLGISFDFKGKTVYLFGDTFSSPNRQGTWYSNFIAVSEENEFYDGIDFSEVITTSRGMAKPFLQGAHNDGHPTDNSVEVTKIPTGAVTIGDTVYLFYMSVRYWGVAGSWNVNYNQCLKSTDLYNWEEVEGLRWTEDLAYNFGQIYPLDDPNSDYIYIYGIPGGRNVKMVCGRVLKSDMENFEKYEYEVADNEWVSGSEGLIELHQNPYYLTENRAAEQCITYNPYLGKYMLLNSVGGVWMFTADKPYQKFEDKVLLFDGSVAGVYGPFTCPNLYEENGKAFYLVGSEWGIYNVHVFKIVLN